MTPAYQQQPAETDCLRAHAEDHLPASPPDLAVPSPEEVKAVVHELHDHPIELKMQNDQLRATQIELEKAHKHYVGLYEHLDALVRERTLHLQEAVGELEHFSYTLAHDLRAPLRIIRGYCGLLLADAATLNLPHREFLQRTASAAERMDQLIRDALDYNKIVRHNFVLAPIDCHTLLNEMVQSYPQFEEARSSISIVGPIPPVLGNPALLTQCFSNLLANALKFVAQGCVPAVRVSAQDLGGRVRIGVQDNGIGVPEDCREKVFEMFQRLNRSYEGTGIGLALVKKAAQRMHGSVGVESAPGQGSCFWLELDKAGPQSSPP